MEFYVLILLLVTISGGQTSSWTSKANERRYKMKVIEEGPDFDWTKTGEVCENELQGCDGLQSAGLCKLEIVRKKCKESCGECRAHAPPNCKISEHGCCWDNVTLAKDKHQKGCPVCANKFDECKDFADQCGRPDIRTMCPITCGIKCKTCEDDKYQKVVCPMYKKYDFCNIDPVLMKRICARTCGLCPS